MPLVNMKEMLNRAYAGGYAVGGFDGFNAETFQAIIQAGLEKKAPALCICGTSEHALLGAKATAAVSSPLSDLYGIPFCLHLDHGRTFEDVVDAIDGGFKSVMIDGSQFSFEENIAITKRVVDYARPKGVSVEAEIGAMGSVTDSSHEGGPKFRTEFTDPAQAAEFVDKTGCDFLAISIGNTHGLYTKPPCLQLDLLAEIRAAVSVPLVLHGGSGTPEDQLKKAVSLGISKVNVASELNRAFNNCYVDAVTTNSQWWAMAKAEAIAEARKVMMRWIDMLGSAGKA
ncbi:MAG: class II fructose-bisphosphate aldolase [Planctomycetes bacterium]|nr:class II fructose-bisphosphate aldolase [Planctomycetota bacterium]